MAKYRKRVEFVEAFCFGNPKNEPHWFREARMDGKVQMVVEENILDGSHDSYSAIITTEMGQISVFPGDYVILNSGGQLEVASAMGFYFAYEEVK